jgi:hypothetical protein
VKINQSKSGNVINECTGNALVSKLILPLNPPIIHHSLLPRYRWQLVKICKPLSAASSARTTIAGYSIVAARSRGRALINMIVNALSRNDVAVAVRPDTVTAVLALFERM